MISEARIRSKNTKMKVISVEKFSENNELSSSNFCVVYIFLIKSIIYK